MYIADEQRPVTLNISGDIPPVRMDDTAISQVIINLLTNASKYSAPTTPITVNLARDERGVAVEVIDRGIGIPKEEIRKIFGKFYRAHGEKTADIEGSGLGLALVKYIAEAHKGHIKVESEEGKGSRFTLILPV